MRRGPADMTGDNTENVEEATMRLILLVLPFLLFLGAVSQAQTSSSMEASPAAIASPAASPRGSVMGQPPMGWPRPYPPWPGFRPRHSRSVRIVAFVLRTLLALSGIFAMTSLGIFLLRRSRPSP
jgi:hypothetical protein